MSSSPQRTPSDAGDLAIDAGELCPQLFSASGEVRLLIRTLIGHPGFQVALLHDRTLVCVDRQDWWVFGHCGHGFGLYTSERHATDAVCRVCREAEVSEKWAELFIGVVRHAASVAAERGNSNATVLNVGFRDA